MEAINEPTPKYKTITITGFTGQPPEGMAADWMTDEDWEKYYERVEKLKESGEYGKPFTANLTMISDPLFDGPGFVLDLDKIETHRFVPLIP